MVNRLFELSMVVALLSLGACVGETPRLPPQSCEVCGSECVDLRTDENHCGACDTKCAAGEVCSSSRCVANCPAGFLACSGTCVDPATNEAFCGANGDCAGANVGAVCEGAESCVGGKCTGPCAAGRLVCEGSCIDPQTDRAFCGAVLDCAEENAGEACAGDQFCVDGACACATGHLVCNGRCVDPRTSTLHCGARGTCAGGDPGGANYAGRACAANEYCGAGACIPMDVCPEGQLKCAGRCVDPLRDVVHCGARGSCTDPAADADAGTPDTGAAADSAGVACAFGEACFGGACKPVLFHASIPVEADTFVESGSTANHGTEEEFVLDRSSKRALLRFDLARLPPGARLRAAALRAVVYTGYAYGGDGIPRAFFVSGDGWGETTVHASNAPAAGTEELANWGLVWFNNNLSERVVQSSSGRLVDFVRQEAAGDGKLSLQVSCSGYRSNYRSREYGDGTKAATLEVDYTLTAPWSCQDLALARPGTPDGEYTLYVRGDSAKPYRAWCHDMAGSAKTYLTLVNTGGDYNFAQYTAGGARPGTDVRTSYSRIRFDPRKLLVDIGDQTFSTSTGSIIHPSGNITSMPYGTAADCITSSSTAGRANVNLVGLPFKVVSSWSVGGAAGNGAVSSSSAYQVWEVSGGGYCGWNNPGPSIFNAANTGVWWNLQLEYVPGGSTVSDLYVVSETNSIAHLRLDADGSLAAKGTVFPGAATPGVVTSIRIDRSARNLYAGGGSTLYAYAIQGDGTLTGQTSLSLPEGYAANMAITPFATDPNYLYLTFASAGVGHVHRIDLAGTAMTDRGTSSLGSFWPAAPYVHPDGLCLYSQHKSPDLYLWASIDRATGALAAGSPITASSALYDRPMRMNPSRTYLYVAATNGIASFEADPATGALSNLQTTATAWAPRDLAVHPSGAWLYVSGSDGAIHRFSINGGAPTDDTAFTSEATVSALRVPAASVLVSMSPGTNRVVSWRIDAATGGLTAADEAEVSSPSQLEASSLP